MRKIPKFNAVKAGSYESRKKIENKKGWRRTFRAI
jgi:hypothetical protein